MEIFVSELTVRESSYKHGCSYDDIINCYRFPITVKIISADPSKYLYIGLDMKGKPIEILVNHNGISVVFHAMKLRKAFERLIK
jgi:hypothetical protein